MKGAEYAMEVKERQKKAAHIYNMHNLKRKRHASDRKGNGLDARRFPCYMESRVT